VSLSPHQSYKVSGVEWLGKIPGHWRVIRLGSLFREVADAGEEGLPILSVSIHHGVSDREFEEEELDRKVTRSDDVTKYKKVRSKDLVYNMMRAWQGGFGTVAVEGLVSPAYVVARPCANFSTKFVEHLLRTPNAVEEMRRRSHGVTDFRLRLYWEEFKSIRIAMPDREEQNAVNAFLDRETRKIDALVAEQEKLIGLLNEKRQAVISHAVTKGLDPSVPMKDSGIEWLGEVPAHWDRAQLGRLCRQVSDGPHFSPNYVDEGVLFLSARNIKVDGWSLEDAKYVSEDDYQEFCKRVVPEKGDILYTKGGTTGIARVVDLEERFQVWVHVAVLKIFTGQVLPDFLSYALNSAGCYEQSQLHTRGATNQDLGLTRMTKIWLALPPLIEQRAIVQALNRETVGLDALINEARRAIDLLKEHRSALISAAVTGKIDVRGLAALQPDQGVLESA
jgi:type I restriction enzyme, S subunit